MLQLSGEKLWLGQNLTLGSCRLLSSQAAGERGSRGQGTRETRRPGLPLGPALGLPCGPHRPERRSAPLCLGVLASLS